MAIYGHLSKTRREYAIPKTPLGRHLVGLFAEMFVWP